MNSNPTNPIQPVQPTNPGPIPGPAQTTTPATTASPTPITTAEQSPKPKSGLKTLIIVILAIVILGVAAIFGAIKYKDEMIKKQIRDRATNDKKITELIYNIRDDARVFYEKNQSYKEWWPKSETLVQVSGLGSTAIYRKPDFQSYIVYAFSQTDNKYFCVDSRGFADFVTSVTDEQIKCQVNN